MKLPKQRTVTLVPASGRVQEHALEGFDLVKFRNALSRRLRTLAPGMEGVFCVDLSLNVGADVGEENHWQLHLHGIATGLRKADRSLIRRALKRDPSCSHRPLVTKKLTDFAGQLAYMAKPNFSRRVSYVDEKGRRNTRIEKLSLVQELELALWLSQYGARQRIFSLGEII